MTDLEKFLIRRGIINIKIKNILRILLLAYANDIVFLSLIAEEMNEILDLLRVYCKETSLTVKIELN